MKKKIKRSFWNHKIFLFNTLLHLINNGIPHIKNKVSMLKLSFFKLKNETFPSKKVKRYISRFLQMA